MSEARKRLEQTLEAPEAFGFLDLVSPDTARHISEHFETILAENTSAIDTAVETAAPKLPGWLRGIVSGVLGGRA